MTSSDSGAASENEDLSSLRSYGKAGEDDRAPEVPASLTVPDGSKVSFHAYAVGVQIYVATASTNSPTGFAWTFRAPEAVLFDADGNVVGMHYAFAGRDCRRSTGHDGGRRG